MPAIAPSFREALRFWLRLGFISFGGPAGQIAIMHRVVVDEKKWISESRFLHALNYCMLLPGPEAQQLATYIGWLLHGRKGGIAAGLLFILPSVFILLALSMLYVSYGKLSAVSALFKGLQPAVVAIVLQAMFRLSKKAMLGPAHYGMALVAFTGIYFFHAPFPLLVLGAIAVAFALQRFLPEMMNSKKSGNGEKQDDDSSYYLNRYNATAAALNAKAVLLRTLPMAFLLWLLPLCTLLLWGGDAGFWKRLSIFFTQAAFVTFGGAYAVLPYVAQVSVEKFQWLSSAQMMDGLALGETTPGPLIMVLAFVGFMAAYHHFGFSLLAGSIGLLTTTWYTFLPGFIFILAGAPLIEQTRDNKKIVQVLSLVTAAVAGVMLNLAIYLGKAVIWPGKHDVFALLWVLTSFVALEKLKLNIILWLLISAVAGLFYYYILIL